VIPADHGLTGDAVLLGADPFGTWFEDDDSQQVADEPLPLRGQRE
jgi:hypothetical protein